MASFDRKNSSWGKRNPCRVKPVYTAANTLSKEDVFNGRYKVNQKVPLRDSFGEVYGWTTVGELVSVDYWSAYCDTIEMGMTDENEIRDYIRETEKESLICYLGL